MNKYLKTLELDKILEMLAEFTSNEETRRMALAVRPDPDLERTRYECLKTSQALELSVQYGTPPFSNFKDISGTAARAVHQFQGRYIYCCPGKVRGGDLAA